MSDVYQGSSPNAHFLAGDVSGAHTPKSRVGGAASISFATHVLGFLLIGYVATHLPEVSNTVTSKMDTIPDIVWLNTPGPGGGGGGGGNKRPEPPQTAQLPGKEKITVPVTKPPKLENPEPPKDVPKPVEQQLTIPAVQAASGVQELPGVISSTPSVGPSLGSGSGGGAGTGTGTGIGSGSGSGFGQGSGGGFGGGAYQPGNGVTSPRLIKEVKPNYTGDAMRAKIQGVVTMEAIVMPDGSVGNVRVTRSLDPTFGLDQEAIKTVKQWRFAPGMRLGQPVPVLVEIEMTFTLR